MIKRIIILMENTNGGTSYHCEHGLSIYVETDQQKIIVDTGASNQTWENAKELGIDLSEIDLLVLSHGHYDHSGGIMGFRQYNTKAPIYMQEDAGKAYFHDERYIGIDPQILNLPGVHLLKGDLDLNPEISIFSDITGRRLWPSSNRVLSVKEAGHLVQDQFLHEQCLVVHGQKEVLISGCAHNGILNILDRYKEIYGNSPDYVISGFHMMKKAEYNDKEIQGILKTAEELAKEKTIYYSGHCTSQKAIDLMKPILKDQLQVLHSGKIIEIG